jgi:hypothetical protein
LGNFQRWGDIEAGMEISHIVSGGSIENSKGRRGKIILNSTVQI